MKSDQKLQHSNSICYFRIFDVISDFLYRCALTRLMLFIGVLTHIRPVIDIIGF